MNTTSSSLSPTVDPRAKRWGNVAKYAALLGVGFVVAPYVFTAITGLLGLIVAGAIMTTTWMLTPWVETKARNLRLMFIKHEAATNPVPTLQNELQRQSVALDERKTAIGHLNGQISTFQDKLDAIGDKYGKQDSAYLKMASQLKDLRRVAKNREDKWQAAYVALKHFADEIERASMLWDAAQAAAAAQESSGLTEEDFMAKLKTETSLDSIRTTFNDTLASLDTDLMQGDAEKMTNVTNTSSQTALPAPDETNVIDVATITNPVRVKSSLAR